MLKSSLIALFASSLCFAACGGGGDGGSGVDGSKDLASLSDSEIISLCEYNQSLFDVDHFNEVNCYSQAVFQTQVMGDCQAVYDTCIADPSTMIDFNCDSAPDDMVPACASDVSVSEMEACFDAQSAQLAAVSLSCSSTPDEVNAALELPVPAACQTVNEKCPELFGE